MVATYKDSGRAYASFNLGSCARRWQVILIFPEAVFFPRFDISPSTEIGGHVLSWFHGSLKHPLI